MACVSPLRGTDGCASDTPGKVKLAGGQAGVDVQTAVVVLKALLARLQCNMIAEGVLHKSRTDVAELVDDVSEVRLAYSRR